jgi:hypothetical protein
MATMKREVDYCQDQYGEFVFNPEPKGQEPSWMTANKELPTIDNDEVVERYVKAKLAFEQAHDEVKASLVYPVKTETPFPCASCLYYKNATEDCDICVVSNPDGTCNHYRKDGYGA